MDPFDDYQRRLAASQPYTHPMASDPSGIPQGRAPRRRQPQQYSSSAGSYEYDAPLSHPGTPQPPAALAPSPDPSARQPTTRSPYLHSDASASSNPFVSHELEPDDDEDRPLTAGTAPAHQQQGYHPGGFARSYDPSFAESSITGDKSLYEASSYGAGTTLADSYGSSRAGLPDPNSFPMPQVGYMSPASTPARSLTRRQTVADAWNRRQREPRRGATKKIVLTNGNFIAEYAVPTVVKNANMMSGQLGGPNEFSHMRYTAACVDPDDFTPENGYTLRTSSYGRQTDLLICITAYNENKVLLARTLHGVMLNVRDMVQGSFSEFKKHADKQHAAENGAAARPGEAWKRVVVSLIFDGIEPADKLALDVLATIGLYQDGVMKRSVDGKETVAHIFEYTTQLSVSAKPSLVEPHPNDPNNLVPVQMIFCLKQKNAKKINSHRWLFNALGRQLQPDVVALIDAGTKPGKRSLYYLWEAFHHNKHLGGACGEIYAMLGNKGRKLLNPLVAAQNFEYKVSNVLDKPNESAFGYVAVLPGAFSAYRFRAIQGRPLSQYFKGDHSYKKNAQLKMSIWAKNMYLAEDRILCFELVAKANERWVLSYVKPAKGETDVPETAAELIGQRRRWLNGSFAAGVYSLVHFGRLYRSDHGIVRLFFLHVQGIFNTVNLVMGWFALANYYLTFSIIIDIVATSLRDPSAIAGGDSTVISCWSGSFVEDTSGDSVDWLGKVNWTFNVIYLAFLVLQIILALGNRPKGEKALYTISFCVYAFFSLYLIFMTVILTIKAFCPITEASGSAFTAFMNQGGTYGPIFAGIIGTFGVYIISALFYLDPWHLFTSMPQYLLIAPSFSNVIGVYAFCNLHDVSWGTKGQTIDLPAAVSKKDSKEGGEKIIEDVERDQADVDLTFKDTVLRAVAPFEEEEESDGPTLDDQNKTFRTRFVTIWLAMNAAVAIGVSQLSSNSRTYYFQAILWTTFGLAAVRLLGFSWYLAGESVFRTARLCARRK